MSRFPAPVALRFPTFAILFILATGWLTAQRTETAYQAVPETRFQAATETRIQPSMITLPPRLEEAFESTETRYNPAGTASRLSVGLISTRRADPGFPAFLLGIQDAAIRRQGAALNVAPLAERTLVDQANFLLRHDVKLLLVDSPDPEEAKAFFSNPKVAGSKVCLITRDLPRGVAPPCVIDSPAFYGESVGEAAIHLVGNNPVDVAWVLTDRVDEKQRTSIRRTFEKPFGNVAPRIRLHQIDPLKGQMPDFEPAVVCVLSAEDSRHLAPVLRAMFPKSKIVCVGESPEVIAAFDGKLIDVRLRPDYERLLLNAIREAEKKSEMPIVLRPVMDRHWE